MEVLNGTTIFWLIALGLLTGAITTVAVWKDGVKLITNLIGGVITSVIVGAISVSLDLPASLLFAFVGSLAVLFIMNVFHLHPETASH